MVYFFINVIQGKYKSLETYGLTTPNASPIETHV